MSSVPRSIFLGAVVVAVPAIAWTDYDVAVNHKDMFGYASVAIAGVMAAGIGAVIGGLTGLVREGRRRSRGQQ